MDDNDGPPRPIDIVGVVGNVRQTHLDGDPTWDVYLPVLSAPSVRVGLAAANMFWIARSAGDPMRPRPASRGKAPHRSRCGGFPDQADGSVPGGCRALRRFGLWRMAAFAAAALALAVTGIYAVVMFAERQGR